MTVTLEQLQLLYLGKIDKVGDTGTAQCIGVMDFTQNPYNIGRSPNMARTGTMDAKGGFPTTRSYQFSFSTYLQGRHFAQDVDDPCVIDALFQACGMIADPDAGKSITYYPPKRPSAVSTDLSWWIDGKQSPMDAFAGNFTISLQAGELAIVNFNCLGRFASTPVDDTMPTVVDKVPPTVLKPYEVYKEYAGVELRAMAGDFTLTPYKWDSKTYTWVEDTPITDLVIPELSFSLGNQLEMPTTLVQGSKGETYWGLGAPVITGRSSVTTFTIQEPPQSVIDFWKYLQADDGVYFTAPQAPCVPIKVSCTLGTIAKQKVTLTSKFTMNMPHDPIPIGGIRYLNISGLADIGYLSAHTDDKDDAKLPGVFELKYE